MIRFQILALTACATPVPPLPAPAGCYTPCGVHVTSGDCESAQRYEGRIIKRLVAAVPNWNAGRICSDLRGFEIRVHHHDPKSDHDCGAHGWRGTLASGCPDGGQNCSVCLAGLTCVSDHTITVETDDWERSALPHEIAHVADEMHLGHCAWRAPLKAALKELSAFDDTTEPEPSCSR